MVFLHIDTIPVAFAHGRLAADRSALRLWRTFVNTLVVHISWRSAEKTCKICLAHLTTTILIILTRQDF
jgi:hypothetical protein